MPKIVDDMKTYLAGRLPKEYSQEDLEKKEAEGLLQKLSELRREVSNSKIMAEDVKNTLVSDIIKAILNVSQKVRMSSAPYLEK